MKRLATAGIRRGRLAGALRLVAAVGVAAACGSSSTPALTPPSPAASAAALEPAAPPLAFRADPAAKTVSFHLVAAHDQSNSGFNFNGYGRGRLAITVPEGWRVMVTCEILWNPTRVNPRLHLV